jgi:hypothetical protein
MVVRVDLPKVLMASRSSKTGVARGGMGAARELFSDRFSICPFRYFPPWACYNE